MPIVQISRILLLPVVIVLFLSISGCSINSAKYQLSSHNVSLLSKLGGGRLSVGDVVPIDSPEVQEPLSFRGNTLASPIGENYGDYIESAIRDELTFAELYDSEADISLSGEILAHKLDASGTLNATADITVTFVLHDSNDEVYRATHTVHRKWASAFAGSTAGERAMRNHLLMIESLLYKLYSDPAFQKSITAKEDS